MSHTLSLFLILLSCARFSAEFSTTRLAGLSLFIALLCEFNDDLNFAIAFFPLSTSFHFHFSHSQFRSVFVKFFHCHHQTFFYYLLKPSSYSHCIKLSRLWSWNSEKSWKWSFCLIIPSLLFIKMIFFSLVYYFASHFAHPSGNNNHNILDRQPTTTI